MPKMLADEGTEYDDGTVATEAQQAKASLAMHSPLFEAHNRQALSHAIVTASGSGQVRHGCHCMFNDAPDASLPAASQCMSGTSGNLQT